LLLGDLGAEVIKVERPGEGDETRHVEPLRNGESHYFLAINRSKLGIAVDMKQPAGREILVELARRSDVFLENFRPGVAKRLGLDYDTLREINPRLVYCSISAFGQTGPYSSRSALDIAIQAMSGVMSVTGEPDGPPTRMGLPMADLCGGLYAVIGVLSGIYERERSGHGQFVDFSMLDGMVGMLMYMATRVFMTGEDSPKIGTGHYGIVPYGAFPTSDGHLVIANIGEMFWPKICAAIGRPELAEDPRYDTNPKRVARPGRGERPAEGGAGDADGRRVGRDPRAVRRPPRPDPGGERGARQCPGPRPRHGQRVRASKAGQVPRARPGDPLPRPRGCPAEGAAAARRGRRAGARRAARLLVREDRGAPPHGGHRWERGGSGDQLSRRACGFRLR